MKPITGLVAGSLLVPLGLAFGLIGVPKVVGDAIAYGAARACQEPIANGSGCWTEVSATVTSTGVVHFRKNPDEWIVQLSDQFGQQRLLVAHRSVFKTLTAGQEVMARFWKSSVVLIRIPGSDDLPTDNEPGSVLGLASLITAITLLGGLVLFLGALGVHHHAGSWTRSVSLAEWSQDAFDEVAPPARLWFQATLFILFFSACATFIAWIYWDVPLLPAATVSFGLAALGWAWLLQHRARTVIHRRSLPRKPR